METPNSAEIAHIGRSVVIKGELSGSEDLYVDGQVEGTIELHGNSLTIGPNGHLRANVNAKNVVVHGKLEGSVKASERTELKKSAVVTGDIFAQKIAIEEGAYFKGKVDIQKESPKSVSAPVIKTETPSAGSNGPERPAPSVTSTAGAAAPSSGSNTVQTGKTPVTE